MFVICFCFYCWFAINLHYLGMYYHRCIPIRVFEGGGGDGHLFGSGYLFALKAACVGYFFQGFKAVLKIFICLFPNP